MAYRIERIIPGDFRDYLMHLWEGNDLPCFIGATSKAYLFDDKEVADAVAQRLAAKCSQTMETPHLKSQPITYEVVKVRDKNMITPEQCGASQLACNIINETFLGLDGFAAMRKQMAGTDYTAEHFGAELARIVDRNIQIDGRAVRPLFDASDETELYHAFNNRGSSSTKRKVAALLREMDRIKGRTTREDQWYAEPAAPKGWESIEA